MQMSLFFWQLTLLGAVLASRSTPRPDIGEYQEAREAAGEKQSENEANASKQAAVDKLLQMMENLRMQVADEGEKEAQSYNKFACWCKSTIAETDESISDCKARLETLGATAERLQSERTDLDEKITQCEESIATDQATSEELQLKRDHELGLFKRDEADLSSALAAIEEAIKVLKASKTPNFLQTVAPIRKEVRKALLLADALMFTRVDRSTSSLFLQAPEVPLDDYTFKSNGVIETLEKLLTEFRTKKNEVDKTEVESVSSHNKAQQALADNIKATEKELKQHQKSRATAIEDLEETSGQYSSERTNLMQDEAFLAQTSQDCTDKGTTWDQRKRVRADELSTLTQVIHIIGEQVKSNISSSTVRLVQRHATVQLAEATARDPRAMERLEAAVEASDASSSAPVFVQIRNLRAAPVDVHVADMAKDAVARLLRSRGAQLRSTVLTSVANRIQGSADPFAKVKQLIQELIERLLTEASNESNQKGWCDKATADSTQHRTLAAEEVEKLNAAMMLGEADIAKMNRIIDKLVEEISELETTYSDAAALRDEENAENEATVDEAEAGLQALNMAIQILDKFYKNAAKEDVTLVQHSAEPPPDAGFENFEAYKGSQSESGGIIGLMEVMRSDFDRTISETEDDEKRAAKEFFDFSTTTNATLAEKNTIKDATQKDLREAEEKYDDDEKNLGSQMELLSTAVKELMELKATCIDTGMTYEDRVRLREEEIAALKKGLCILEHSALGADAVDEC